MKKYIFLILFTLTAIYGTTQVQVNIELKNLINQSFTYYPKVKEINNTISTAQQKLELTKLNNMPEITGNASYAYIQPKITIPLGGTDFQFAPVNSINASVNAQYALFDFGRLKANIEKSKDELQTATHNLANVKSQLAYQVSTIYYNLVYLKKAIAIQDSIIQFLTDNKKIVDAKLKNGDALKIDVLNIQAAIDNEQNRKVDIQNTIQKQLNLLAYTSGTNFENGTNFDFDLSATSNIDDLISIAQATNMDFVIMKDKIKEALSDVNIAKLSNKPMVGLQAAAGYKNGYVPEVENPRFNYLAGIGITIPIYNGGKTKQQVKLAQNIVKQNELAQETLNNDYKKNIQQALTDIKSNMERIQNTNGQIEEAVYAEKLAASRFLNGTGTNLELTNAGTNVQRAALTRLQYEYQLCLAKIELARLIGYQYW
ncbi:TolC family protein [Hydrotalea sp.]|uniref:TolC family protein n=1 Tax=Hydrotalea sp. TaxID=2881279 RepID=UPI0026016255|nr:TolC family protein [Hydrotalea sp.]